MSAQLQFSRDIDSLNMFGSSVSNPTKQWQHFLTNHRQIPRQITGIITLQNEWNDVIIRSIFWDNRITVITISQNISHPSRFPLGTLKITISLDTKWNFEWLAITKNKINTTLTIMKMSTFKVLSTNFKRIISSKIKHLSRSWITA